MPPNIGPWTKLGYDSCPSLLTFYRRQEESKDKTPISSILANEQANIFLIAYTNEKVEVETFSKFDTSSSVSSNDEEDKPYDVLQNYHTISFQCQKYKTSIFENTQLKKSNKVSKKKIQTLEESLIQASQIDESSIVEKLIEEVTCLAKDFGKFQESSNTLTMLLKFHQLPNDKLVQVQKKEHYLPSCSLIQTNVTFVVVATYPLTGGRGKKQNYVFQKSKTCGVATKVYLRKTLEKPKRK